MGPRVTLIGEPWATRTMVFGKKRFVFNGGQPKEVPVSVALFLKTRKDESGNALFKVEGLPVIVKAVHPEIEKPVSQEPVVKEPKVPRNRKIEEWLS